MGAISMDRIWKNYNKWEDYNAGMYATGKIDKKQLIQEHAAQVACK